jgi:transcription antitermination factor NusG
VNLIEQLGGYERAKHEFEMIKEMKPICLGEIETNDRLLLEHRRQHNIFEVGDKVVVKAHPFWPEDYVILTVEQEHIGKWYMSAWRHAEPEEIKAGKRLEVK